MWHVYTSRLRAVSMFLSAHMANVAPALLARWPAGSAKNILQSSATANRATKDL